MSKKETGNKKHKLRRFFIASTIVSAVAFLGATISLVVMPVPLMLVTELCLLVGAASTAIGVGVGINALHSKISSDRNKKASVKALQKIAEADANKSVEMSREDRVKLVKKYAHANLRLCKLNGCPITGKFHSISGMSKISDTENFNALENLELLRGAESTVKGRKKFDGKISKKKKLVTKANVRSVPQRWTKSYDDFIDGVSIYDRRTEIGCLTTKTGEAFQRLVEIMSPTDEIGGSVILTFRDSNKTKQTYARVADTSLLPEVSKLMMQDVLSACDGKSPYEISTMFPFRIESHTVNKNSTKISPIETKVISSLDQLKYELGMSTEAER
ncbi:MAG: hypothetical protein E7376_03755 [Clostridiales bacterium]|nr:hypothetical protein [Clostridiales bacterium]